MEKRKARFQKLTPIGDIPTGIYRDAIDFVFNDDDLTNIAISGAYGAGKSSILEAYKLSNSEKKFINISFAHFGSEEEVSGDSFSAAGSSSDVESTVDDRSKTVGSRRVPDLQMVVEKKSPQPSLESILEGKILNQIIHQIPLSRIPQTSFRIKQKISRSKLILLVAGVVFCALSCLHILFFRAWQKYALSISTISVRRALLISTRNSSLLLSGAISLVLLSVFLYKLIYYQVSRGGLKKISADKFSIEIFEGSNDSYFDKYLNEVLYLFDHCGADVIVFEDIDRHNVIRVFERLREINKLVNDQRREEKEKDRGVLRFFYLLRDDIFSSKDRTKFFDFIIPVVPVVDSTNSYNKLIELFADAAGQNPFDESFLRGLSLFIDDMRILKNICNEFFIYDSQINTIDLNPNKLLAAITYKNLFPRDFSDSQLGRGYVSTLFDTQKALIIKQVAEGEKKQLEAAEEELKEFLKEHPKSTKAKELLDIRDRISNTEELIAKTKNLTLRAAITRDNEAEVFAVVRKNDAGKETHFDDVRSSNYFDLLKYLIRDGYLDEHFADYLTYFYDNDLSVKDKKFLLSVYEHKEIGAVYDLDEPKKVFSNLSLHDFSQPETLNIDLLTYLLEECSGRYEFEGLVDTSGELAFQSFFMHGTEKERKCLDAMIEQGLNSQPVFPELVYFFANDERMSGLVNYLNYSRKDYLMGILADQESINRVYRDDFVFRSIIGTPTYYLIGDENFKSALSAYVSDAARLFDKERYEKDKISKMFGIEPGILFTKAPFSENMKVLGIRLTNIEYDKTTPQLFDMVYENNLYKLSFDNIHQIIKVKYGIRREEDLSHKNYSVVRTQPDSPLAIYVEQEIDGYISEIIKYSNGKINDGEAVALQVLNNNDISDEHKKTYIKALVTTIKKLSDVTDETLWESLIISGCVAHNEKNVLDYFIECGNEITDELVQFINGDQKKYDFSELPYDKCSKEIQSTFFDAVIECSQLNDDHYSQILSTIGWHYNKDFSFIDIAAAKMDILISNHVILMSESNLSVVREHYRNNLINFIASNIEEYCDLVIGSALFNDEEALEALGADISDNYKLKLLEEMRGTITAIRSTYSDAIKAHILLNNLLPSDLQHFVTNYTNEEPKTKAAIILQVLTWIKDPYTEPISVPSELFDAIVQANPDLVRADKISLFSYVLPTLDETTCKHYLEQLELYDFLSLFNRKRPKIEITDANERMLKTFQKKRWINKYSVDGVFNKCFRAYGRKSRM